MADYIAQARSNYFRVKDEAAFREWAALREMEVWAKDKNGKTYFAIISADPDSGGWRRFTCTEETQECLEIDIQAELASHLQDESVAVLMEIGAEGLRYLNGVSTAINSRGETVRVDLRDIYEAARHLGAEITDAEY